MRNFRRYLGLKLLFSYLLVILAGILVLGLAAEIAIPNVFDRHMAGMAGFMEGRGGMGMGNFGPGGMMGNLYTSFRTAVTEALTWGTLAAFVVALVVSVFVSRRVLRPIQALMAASRDIAAGRYDKRVPTPGGVSREDYDELDQLAVSFNQMAAQLDQTEAMRRQMIGDISHELRTPLTTIKGSIEGLIDGVLLPEAETYQEIYREADRLERLVADLQELSRVEGGGLELNRIAVDLGALVGVVGQRLQRQFDEKEVDLRIANVDELPPAWADEDRIAQVLVNLIGNALQYTPAGGQVTVMVDEEAGNLQVLVRDSGVGIAAEHLPHVFSRFYRVDKSRARAGGGSGIGLTIARRLVEAHGGKIWAESEGLGQGSTFGFSLPGVDK